MFQFVNVFVLGFILSVPLLCIVTFNGMVVYKLQNRMSTMTKKDRDITVSLVFVSVAFFVNMMITCVSLVIVFNSKTVDDSTRNLLNWLKVIFEYSFLILRLTAIKKMFHPKKSA